jgi:hypothetical protein
MRDASFVPDLDAWEPWRPEEVAARLESMRAPWAIAGGWAIDLYLGEQTRAHKDIEIAIDRDQAATVWACLDDLDWFAIGRGRAWPLADAPPQLHQTWGRDRALRRWRLDVLREPWDGGDWVFRRDSRIRRPLAQAIDRNSDAVPFLAPELVLLFKAASPREDDEADLARIIPVLTGGQIEWLAGSLRLVHPTHEWLERLSGRI